MPSGLSLSATRKSRKVPQSMLVIRTPSWRPYRDVGVPAPPDRHCPPKTLNRPSATGNRRPTGRRTLPGGPLPGGAHTSPGDAVPAPCPAIAGHHSGGPIHPPGQNRAARNRAADWRHHTLCRAIARHRTPCRPIGRHHTVPPIGGTIPPARSGRRAAGPPPVLSLAFARRFCAAPLGGTIPCRPVGRHRTPCRAIARHRSRRPDRVGGPPPPDADLNKLRTLRDCVPRGGTRAREGLRAPPGLRAPRRAGPPKADRRRAARNRAGLRRHHTPCRRLAAPCLAAPFPPANWPADAWPPPKGRRHCIKIQEHMAPRGGGMGIFPGGGGPMGKTSSWGTWALSWKHGGTGACNLARPMGALIMESSCLWGFGLHGKWDVPKK